ncbi:DUF11 domain-containing protein, partial [Croceitalea dokdonensis]|uniref:DUF11 domain-containing protein n=1 Tax=Croceitalea dokdonensis TaxID=346188 RepID=UPI0009F9DF30
MKNPQRHYPRLCSILLIAVSFLLHSQLFAQLSDVHYLPPLKQGGNTQAIRQQAFYLSTPETTAFNVNVFQGTGASPVATLSISNTSPGKYDVPDGDNNISLVDNNNTGIVLSASGLRFVAPGGQKFYVNYRGRSGSQATSLTSKGIAAAGTSFKWGGIPNRANTSSVTSTLGIMATEDNTVINIFGYDPDCEFRLQGNRGGITADNIQITLNAGQTYVLEAAKNETPANIDGWLGASIQSDKKIVISNGGLNVGVRTTSAARDAAIDQPVPENVLGREYVFIRGNGQTNNETEFPIIIATQNNTEIFVNGASTPIATLNNGDYFEVPGSNYSSNTAGANMFVRTSKEAYAYQCLTGASGIQTLGLNFIAPVNCLLPSALSNIPNIQDVDGLNFNGGVTIVASTTTPDANITLTDGTGNVALPASIPVAGTSDWKTFFIAGLTGEVSVNSTGPIAVGFLGASGNAGLGGYFSGFDTVPVVELDVTGGGCLPADVFESTGGFDAYQWFFNGQELVGETNSSYTPTAPGDFFVRVTKGTCTYDSAILSAYNCSPELVLTKVDDVDPVTEGNTVTFTISAEYLGFNPISNLVVQDILPPEFTISNTVTSAGTWSSPNWTIGDMFPGEVFTLEIEATANDVGADVTVTNSISASFTEEGTQTNDIPDDLLEETTILNDNDGDGIPDNSDPDDDNDGISDAQEVTDGTDPNDDCSSVGGTPLGNSDCDNDGLTTDEETTGVDDPSTPADPNGETTDPNNADTDGDGISDGQEALDGTDPNDSCNSVGGTPLGTADCDNDGLTNDEETTGVDDPSTPADPNGETTDPNVADTDGDGISDGQEALDGTDPNDSCDSVGGTPLGTDDCDGDGNPNADDPNPTVATAVDDNTTADVGVPKTLNILFNDDFLVGSTVTITGGTAAGTVSFDAVTGELTYTAIAAEDNSTVTVTYEVCNGTVCDTATVFITIPACTDTDGDNVCDVDDSAPNDPCEPMTDPNWIPVGTSDCDGDGLTYNEESTGVDDPSTPADPNGETTDPNNADTDGDGISDGQEALDGTDPNDDCSSIGGTPLPAGDCDGDGVPNASDRCQGFDDSSDNDSDGVPDGCDQDDDNDGILDVDECPVEASDIFNYSIANGDAFSNSFITGSGTLVLDAFTLDNSFSLTINGVNIGGELEFQENTNNVIRFLDGFEYGQNGVPEIWQLTGNSLAPIVRLTIDASGVVRLFGARSSGGPLEPLETTFPLENVVWNATAPNELVLDQLVFGPTSITGNVSFVTLCDTDGDSIPNQFDNDADNDGCPDALEGNGPFNLASIEPNGQLSGAVDAATGIPNSAGNGQSNTSAADGAVTGGSCDDDNDGLTNDEESTGVDDPSTPADPNGETTDPNNADTDGDGISDGQEALDGTDPNDSCSSVGGTPLGTADCDNDGLTNDEETTGVDDPSTPADPNGETTDPNVADTDGDGISDGQEALDGTDPNDSCDSVGGTPLGTDDCDGDGNPNADDPNPTVATAVDDNTTADVGVPKTLNILFNDDFLVGSPVTITGGTAAGTVSFDAVTGELTYTAIAAEDNSTVTVTYEVCNGTVCDTATVFITIPACTDTDGDNVCDVDDSAPNDPCEPMTDPNWIPVGTSDCDGDGLTYNEESTGVDDPSTPADPNGETTDPNNADTDGDGISDGQEALDGTDPNDDCSSIGGTPLGNSDCDNDGLTTDEETTGVDDPSTPADPNGETTDPNNADTDGDGISDGQEALDGTDPNDSCDSVGGTPLGTADCDNDGLTNDEEATGVD